MKNLHGKCLSIVGILIVLLGLTPVLPVQAAPYVIDADTTWSGTVYLDRDVYVMATAKLTISPGTKVVINNTDQSGFGIDSELVEIIIDGELEAVGAEFYYFGGAGRWYGIRSAGNTWIENCKISNAIRAITVNDLHQVKTVGISGNEIRDMTGKPGTPGSVFGKPAYGIYVQAGKPTIANNVIHNIAGGIGLAGTLDLQGGVGGEAAGIYINSLGNNTTVTENTITNVRGGNGGAGYNGSPGSGEHGSWGGAGGIAYGIRIVDGSAIKVIGNQISDIQSGYGGHGGHGGSALPNNDGGWGGAGGNSGTAYGMRVANAENLDITGNQIDNIRAGVPGVGGNAGAGDGTGHGGVGGRGGNGGIVNGFNLQNAVFDPRLGGFNANQIYNLTGANGRNGGSGGAGGATGNGGQGGNGGHSSVVRALNFSCVGVDPCPDPGPIVNNVIAFVNANRGGHGGNGGTGGTGGNGGNGGDTREASLLNLDNIGTLTITNNTLYGAVSHNLGGNGGSKGGVSANDGTPGDRAVPVGINAAHGNYFIYNNIIVQVDNSTPDGYGIWQATGGKVTADNNTLNAPGNVFWYDNFYNVPIDNQGNLIERPPGFINPARLNFRLNAGSDMIDAGNGELDETPLLDIVGRERPNGDRVDLGAYEFYFVNQPPYFTSTEVTEAIAGRWYSYQVEASDPNSGRGEQLIIYATTLPRWLTLVDHGDGTATLSGQPGSEHLGDHAVWLVVQDWDGETDEQRFLIEVNELSPPPAFSKNMPTNGAVDQPTSQMLSWQNTAHIDKFEYCLGSVSGTCDITGWTNIGTATSVMISIAPDTTNFWQVRAINAAGTTYANNGDWWSFTTVEGQPQHSIFLPLILR